MPSKLIRDVLDEEYEFELPISFVDVVFLLLIFFLCATNFRTTEKKLDANLPKDEGLMSRPVQFEIPHEIRVKLYWANATPEPPQWPFGQCIHSPSAAFPVRWEEFGHVRRADITTAGAHIVIQIGRIQCGNLNDLYSKLKEMTERQPDTPVVIDARQAIPFKWVLGAIDSCVRAKVENVKFQAPAVEEGGGDDWWHM